MKFFMSKSGITKMQSIVIVALIAVVGIGAAAYASTINPPFTQSPSPSISPPQSDSPTISPSPTPPTDPSTSPPEPSASVSSSPKQSSPSVSPYSTQSSYPTLTPSSAALSPNPSISPSPAILPIASGKLNATMELTYSPTNGGVILTATLSVPRNGTVTNYWAINNTGFINHVEGQMVNGVFSRTHQFYYTGTFQFKVYWIGDAEVNAVESNTITVNNLG